MCSICFGQFTPECSLSAPGSSIFIFVVVSSQSLKKNTLFKVMYEEEKKMDITAEFKDLVAQYSSVTAEEMTDDMRLRDDLGLSSLDFMTLLGELEDTFDFELDVDRATQVVTIADAVKMIEDLREA